MQVMQKCVLPRSQAKLDFCFLRPMGGLKDNCGTCDISSTMIPFYARIKACQLGCRYPRSTTHAKELACKRATSFHHKFHSSTPFGFQPRFQALLPLCNGCWQVIQFHHKFHSSTINPSLPHQFCSFTQASFMKHAEACFCKSASCAKVNSTKATGTLVRLVNPQKKADS